jgi:anti-anti-sigma regulatory factor
VLNCAGVNHIDLSGIESLQGLFVTLQSRKIDTAFMMLKDGVLGPLTRSGLLHHHTYLHGVAELKKWCGRVEKAERRC